MLKPGKCGAGAKGLPPSQPFQQVPEDSWAGTVGRADAVVLPPLVDHLGSPSAGLWCIGDSPQKNWGREE